jgi:hypothetical protein
MGKKWQIAVIPSLVYLRIFIRMSKTLPNTGSGIKPLPCVRAKTEILCFRPLSGGLPNYSDFYFFTIVPIILSSF